MSVSLCLFICVTHIILLLKKIMALLFDFNFLPPHEDHVVYNTAAELLLIEFKDQIPPEAYEYLKKKLVKNKPEGIGGRAVGLQGMTGNTNGLEKKNGWLKTTWEETTVDVNGSERNNPIHFLHAAAINVSTRTNAEESFASSPVISAQNYSIIKSLSEAHTSTLPRVKQMLFADIAYAQCELCDANGVCSLKDVVGKGNVSYIVWMPATGLLYTLARKMMIENTYQHHLAFASFEEQNMSNGMMIDVNNTDYKYWSGVVQQLKWEEKLVLYNMLTVNLKNFTLLAQPNERCREYINRCGQRAGGEKCGGHDMIQGGDGSDGSKKKGKGGKGRKTEPPSLKEKKAALDDKDKWGDNNDSSKRLDGEDDDNSPMLNNDDSDDEEEWGIDLGEEPDLETIVTHLGELFPNINVEEVETMRMVASSEAVKVPRQLGHWRRICIDADLRKVTCNCHKCNTDGRCYWVDTFEAIEFGSVVPKDKYFKGGDVTIGFDNMVNQATEVMKLHNLKPDAINNNKRG